MTLRPFYLTKIASVLCILLFTVAPLVGQNALLKHSLQDSVKHYSTSFPPGTQLAIGIVTDDTVQLQGFLRQADSLISINNAAHIFEIGSITKVFTASLLAKMVIAGEVALDSPISSYLDLPLAGDIGKLTLRALSNHTSGLPRLPNNFFSSGTSITNPYATYDRERLTAFLKSEIWLPSDSISYAYSNLGAGLLGFILSEVKEETLASLLKREVFSLHNMRHTYVEHVPDSMVFVKGLAPNGQAVGNWDFTALAGAGAIKSNARDMSHFLEAQLDRTQEALQLTQELTFDINEHLSIGLGWHYLKKQGYYWHNGGTGGYTSTILFDPVSKSGVVVLTNVSAFHPDGAKVDQLGLALMKLLP